MPYPTVEIGDTVTFVNNAGVTRPAVATSTAAAGVISLVSDGVSIHKAPFDATGAQYNSWNWVTNAGSNVGNWNAQGGTTYQVTAADRYIALSDDAARVITLVALPAGATLTFLDTSGSVTSGHTITFTGTPTVHGTATITPGTNKACTLVSDGTDFWLLYKQ